MTEAFQMSSYAFADHPLAFAEAVVDIIREIIPARISVMCLLGVATVKSKFFDVDALYIESGLRGLHEGELLKYMWHSLATTTYRTRSSCWMRTFARAAIYQKLDVPDFMRPQLWDAMATASAAREVDSCINAHMLSRQNVEAVVVPDDDSSIDSAE